MSVKTKKKGWFKVCPEKWIFGSTREEMTPAERGVWIDFLALAYMNDPPGQIDFFTERRLANKLNISVKLLKSTIEKATAYGKIELDGTPIASNFDEKKDKTGSKRVQPDSKRGELVSSRSKFGIPQRTIKILKWNEYQSEYLRQKPYRQKRYEQEESREDEKEHDEKLQNSNPKSVTQVTDRGEERRGDNIRGEERRENDSEVSDLSESEPSSSLPSNSISNSFTEGKKVSTLKEEFLSRLKECPGYPFDEYGDSVFFLNAVEEYPDIDILKELDKKIAWWKEHPEALKQQRKIPSAQLDDWFSKEQEFQKRKGDY